MSQVSIIQPDNLGNNDRARAGQLQSQINRGTQVRNASSVIPTQWNKGDVAVDIGNSFVTIRVGQDRNTHSKVQIPKGYDYGYISYQTGTGAPTTANFPSTGNYGFYEDTATSWVYFGINHADTVALQNMQTLAGSLLYPQHGDLSSTANTSINHSFVQVSGTITAAQHGNFTASTANSALHGLATTAFNGFLSSSGFSMLANATNIATGGELARRNTNGNCNFIDVNLDASTAKLLVNGTQVVKSRITWSGSPSGTLSSAAFTTFAQSYAATYSAAASATYDQAQIDILINQVEALADAMSATQSGLVVNSRRVGRVISDLMEHGLIHT